MWDVLDAAPDAMIDALERIAFVNIHVDADRRRRPSLQDEQERRPFTMATSRRPPSAAAYHPRVETFLSSRASSQSQSERTRSPIGSGGRKAQGDEKALSASEDSSLRVQRRPS